MNAKEARTEIILVLVASLSLDYHTFPSDLVIASKTGNA